MDEYNEKDQTMEFRPHKEEKVYVDRGEDNIYSEGRKNSNYYNPENERSKSLVYVAIVLAILLIIAIIVGIIVLSNGNSSKNEEMPQNQEIVMDNEENEEVEEEEEPAEAEKINFYNIVFYGDSVIKTDEGYSILADLYDDSFEKKDNRKLFINEETDIRENGQRLSAQGLVYAVESMAGEGVVFEGKIRESDDVVISISYEGSFEEEMNPPEEEIPEEIEGEEVSPEEENTENVQIPEDGVIIE